MLKKIASIKSLQFLICAFFLSIVFLSCKSTPKANDVNLAKGEYEATEEKTSMISLDVPKKNTNSYFYKISEEALSEAANGSPESIRKAVSLVRKSELDYTENEKVFLVMLSEIMKIVWPSERIDWDIPNVNVATAYLGAIDSAKKGIYDLSTGNVDFFTTVLPSLVIVNSVNVSRFSEDAESALKKGLSMHPNSTLVKYLLGILYEKTNKLQDAFDEFSKASDVSPNCKELSYAKANILLKLEKFNDAQIIANSLLSTYPSDIQVLKLCAQTEFKLNNFALAEEYVARVLQQAPNDLEFILFRARILAEKGDYIRATSLLDVYSRQDSTSKDYLLLRTRVQIEWSKNITAATETITNALNLYPNDSEVLLLAARLSATTGAKIAGKTAQDFSQNVLKNDPNNINAIRYEIVGMMQNKKWKNAYDSSKKLLSITTSRSDEFTHVKICLELSKYDEAWNIISPLYNENQDDEEVLQYYILVLTRTGKSSQALTLINARLPKASSKMKSFFYYRRSFLQNSQEDALADLRSSLISNPRNSDALFRLYEIYYDKRDYRKAQYYLKQVVALDPNNAEMRKLNDDLTKLIK